MISSEAQDRQIPATTSPGNREECSISMTTAEGSTVQASPLPEGSEAGESPAPVIIGKYRVVERLGRGGQADVFRAVHPGLPGQDVVIKWVRTSGPEALQRKAIEEGRILSRLRVPGLIRVYDADTHEGRPFLVLEYLP